MNQTPIIDFDYDLPDEKIAKYPIEPRHNSKLLVYKDGVIEEDRYLSLPEKLPENTVLIMNNTKVIEARLLFQKETGGQIEVFCLEHHEKYGDVTAAMAVTDQVDWYCQVGGAKKWKTGKLSLQYQINNKKYEMTAEKIDQLEGSFLIHFSWNDDKMTFAEVLHHAGNIPLPPYLNRKAEEKDKNTYQTVYAQHDGSVAAPTAGLHFTPELFDQLSLKGIQSNYVTLHVGAGTFKPVKTETVEEHSMHAEFIDIPLSFLDSFNNQLKEVRIAVGTTSLRTLESLYWMGVKIIANPNISLENLAIQQWEAYELNQNIDLFSSFEALQKWMISNQLDGLISKTQLMIKPGYQIKTVNGILTNFHQPKSTLLLLIHAFVGEDWKRIYQYALDHNYRFLSYGDGSLLWKREH